jgi:hypothetical protein
MRTSSDSLVPRAFRVGVAAVALMSALTLMHPQRASAGVNYFCYANGDYFLAAPNGYCVGPGYQHLWQVRWALKNGPGVNHCATSKFYRDGSGHNAHQAQCGTQQYVYTNCAIITAAPLYPKGTNESASSHYYRGGAAYSQCFI